MDTSPAPAMDTIILAGGKGTRLSSVVHDLPKPLAPIAGKPFLDYLMNFVESSGIAGNTVLSIGHKAEHIRDWARRRSGKIILVEEAAPLGTGGAILHALDTAVRSDTVLIMNGDSFVNMDLVEMAQIHLRSGYALTMAVTEVADVSRFGEVRIVNDRVNNFLEKGGSRRPGHINAGAYMANKKAFVPFSRGSCSFERDIIPEFLNSGINAYSKTSSFIDIGTPESYSRAAEILEIAS